MNSDPVYGAPAPGEYRAGFVSILGRPNVGKSTLQNAFLGFKISIVSPTPQTTRRRILGILTLDDAQVIFCDTPGVHQPHHDLGRAMLRTASEAIPDADVLLWMVDATRRPGQEDAQVADLIVQRGRGIPLILALNKSDQVPQEERAAVAESFLALATPDAWLFVSATQGENRDELLQTLISYLPVSPAYYPDDQVTDQTERAIAAELVREQVLLHTRQEVPHAVDVRVDEFKVRSKDMTYIHATVIVERDSQRQILLGRGGRMIKSISQAARKQIEELVGTRVYLELWVKVLPRWRKDDQELRRLGYT
jgi:GTP-binding protein Era